MSVRITDNQFFTLLMISFNSKFEKQGSRLQRAFTLIITFDPHKNSVRYKERVHSGLVICLGYQTGNKELRDN